MSIMSMSLMLVLLFFTIFEGGITFFIVNRCFNFSKKKTIKISCCVGVALSLMVGIFIANIEKLDNHSSHNTQSKYDTDLDNGLDKLYNGETLTEDEEDAVNDFYEWNDKQYRNK